MVLLNELLRDRCMRPLPVEQERDWPLVARRQFGRACILVAALRDNWSRAPYGE